MSSRKNKRLKRKVCLALNAEWKSARNISDEIGGYCYSIGGILRVLARYNLLEKKKILVPSGYTEYSISVYKMQDDVTVNDLLNALGLR